MIYANPASSVVLSLQHPPYPPLSSGLQCKALMSAHFPADGLTGTTPNALCPHPNLWRRKAHMKSISQSVIRNTGLGNRGKTRTRQKLISSVSPSPLTVWVALTVTCYLADGREAQLQNQIQRRIRSTVGQTCKNSEQSFAQISLLKDQTVKGDHVDMFWVCWNTQPLLHADRGTYEL